MVAIKARIQDEFRSPGLFRHAHMGDGDQGKDGQRHRRANRGDGSHIKQQCQGKDQQGGDHQTLRASLLAAGASGKNRRQGAIFRHGIGGADRSIEL